MTYLPKKIGKVSKDNQRQSQKNHRDVNLKAVINLVEEISVINLIGEKYNKKKSEI